MFLRHALQILEGSKARNNISFRVTLTSLSLKSGTPQIAACFWLYNLSNNSSRIIGMTQVFISYSRKDLSFINTLVADLKNAGLDVWYDVSHIAGGARWRSEIENALRNSQ